MICPPCQNQNHDKCTDKVGCACQHRKAYKMVDPEGKTLLVPEGNSDDKTRP